MDDQCAATPMDDLIDYFMTELREGWRVMTERRDGLASSAHGDPAFNAALLARLATPPSPVAPEGLVERLTHLANISCPHDMGWDRELGPIGCDLEAEGKGGCFCAGFVPPMREAASALTRMAGEIERLKAALTEQSCPRPATGRPDDLTIGECVGFRECGCGARAALAEPAKEAPKPGADECPECHKYVGKCPACHRPRPLVTEDTSNG